MAEGADVGERPLDADLLPDLAHRDPPALPGAGELKGELELAEGLGAARTEDEERLARGIRHDGDRRRHELFAGLHGGEVIVESGFRGATPTTA